MKKEINIQNLLVESIRTVTFNVLPLIIILFNVYDAGYTSKTLEEIKNVPHNQVIKYTGYNQLIDLISFFLCYFPVSYGIIIDTIKKEKISFSKIINYLRKYTLATFLIIFVTYPFGLLIFFKNNWFVKMYAKLLGNVIYINIIKIIFLGFITLIISNNANFSFAIKCFLKTLQKFYREIFFLIIINIIFTNITNFVTKVNVNLSYLGIYMSWIVNVAIMVLFVKTSAMIGSKNE